MRPKRKNTCEKLVSIGACHIDLKQDKGGVVSARKRDTIEDTLERGENRVEGTTCCNTRRRTSVAGLWHANFSSDY